MKWTLENIIVVELAAGLCVAVVAAWASGATWRDIIGIGESDPPPTEADAYRLWEQAATNRRDLGTELGLDPTEMDLRLIEIEAELARGDL